MTKFDKNKKLTAHFDLLKSVDVKFEVMRQKRDRKKRNMNGLLEPNRTTTIHAHCHMEVGRNKMIWDTVDEWNWMSKATTHIAQVWRPYTCGSNFSQYFFIFVKISPWIRKFQFYSWSFNCLKSLKSNLIFFFSLKSSTNFFCQHFENLKQS